MNNVKFSVKNQRQAMETYGQIIKALLFNSELEVTVSPKKEESFISGLDAETIAFI